MYIIDAFDKDDYNENRKGGEMDMEAAVDFAEKLQQTEWLTTGEAKKALGVSSVNTVKRWVAEGKLTGRKFGRNNWMRISTESIRRLLDSKDQDVQAFQKLKNQFDDMSDLDVQVTEEDFAQMSDREMGTLPWEKSKGK